MPDEAKMGQIELPTGRGPQYALDGVAPRIASDAFVVSAAAVIGDEVTIGHGAIIYSAGCAIAPSSACNRDRSQTRHEGKPSA